MPLQFTNSGSYEFDENITMSYTDINGNMISNTSKPFTVVVNDESAPYFLNEVEIKGNQEYSPDSLVKVQIRF